MNHASTTNALLEAVYAAPDDDAPRAVLSDWLQEQNDPRGQFISLQLREHAGTATNAEVAQAQRLVEVHGSQWIGNLAPAVAWVGFRRGFLSWLELAWFSRDEASTLDPVLSTVEKVSCGSDAQTKQFLKSRILQRSLRHLTVESDMLWDEVVQCTGLTSIECTEWSGNLVEDRFRDLVLPFLERTRSIQEVGCHLWMLARFSSGLRNRITSLRVPDLVANWQLAWEALPRLRRLEIGGRQRFEFRQASGARFIVRLVQPDSRRMVEVQRDLQFIPAGSRLEVIGNPRIAARLAVLFGKRFEVVSRPAPSGLLIIRRNG